jgi:CDP-diacylglycerol--serine O-phosphatidyltransferase
VTRKRAKDSLKKGVYVLPNLITSASLCAGFYSITATFNQNFEHAAVAILAAVIFDGLDGRVARMTHTTTRFGVEYDSLADLVSFGVAPALLIYEWALRPFGRVGWVGAFLYMICGALRLARFNVQVNTVEKGKFNGLPIPGAATFIAAGIWAWSGIASSGGPGSPLSSLLPLGGEWTVRPLAVLLAVYVLALLMVSTVKFNSFKDLDPFLRRPFNTLVLFVLFLVLLMTDPPVMIFLSIAAYVVSGPVGEVVGALRRRRSGHHPKEGGRDEEDGHDAD